MDGIIADGLRGPLVDIVKAAQIQPIEVLKTVTEQFGLETEVRRGFLWLQFQHINKCYATISFSRLTELLHVDIEEIETLIASSDFRLQIDREAEVIYFDSERGPDKGDRVRELLRGIMDVGYMIYSK